MRYPDEHVQQVVEDALSSIFAHDLPLNPGSLVDVVQQCPDACSSQEVLAYMQYEYGWNADFTARPLYPSEEE